jgi:hypothetical protein
MIRMEQVALHTQGQDLRDLQQQITEAVAVHFDEGAAPRRIRIRAR